ncbi:MAG TPA: hypothetical protein VJ603_03920 [Paucimonas sp.]|nr:hypothetical protein [Paucimonas sp.]HJW54840.1 hypothetical protein [Burkholderiaceae bacterium]
MNVLAFENTGQSKVIARNRLEMLPAVDIAFAGSCRSLRASTLPIAFQI